MIAMSLDELFARYGWVLVAYGVMSAITFVAYVIDKSAARRGRIAEASLHLLALLGGWPGALIAITVVRHKRRKVSFVLVVWLVAASHVAGWIWWTTRSGA